MAVFKSFFGVAARVKKHQVNVGVRKQPAPAKTAEGDQSEIAGAFDLGRDQFMPQAARDRFYEGRAPQQSGSSIARGRKIPLDARGFRRVKLSEFNRPVTSR